MINLTISVAAAAVWESDDTLSDGGDFYEDLKHQRPSVLVTSIPIVPVGPVCFHLLLISLCINMLYTYTYYIHTLPG